MGDLDPDAEGAEIAAVSRDGSFYLATRRGDGWEARVVFRVPGEVPGEMIQCAVGDAWPARPGLEIVAVGMAAGPEANAGPGAAYVVSRSEGGWHGERIADSDALLHAVCVDDGSVFIAGYDRKLTRVTHDGEGWRAETIGDLPGAGKAACATRGGVVVACTDGSVVLFRPVDGAWSRTTLDHRETGRARLGAHANRIVVADDDGTFSILEDDRRVELWRSPDKLRGAALADLDPERPGLEAATAGYSRSATLLLPTAGELVSTSTNRPTVEVVEPYVDLDRIHHLTAGNVDADPADEIVLCGYSGLLVVVDREGSR